MTQLITPISPDPVTGLARKVEWLANNYWDNRICEIETLWNVNHYDQNDTFLFARLVRSHLSNAIKVDEKGMRIYPPVLNTDGLDESDAEKARITYEQELEAYNNALGQYDYWTGLLEKGIPYSQIMGGAVLELDKINYWD